MFIPFTSLTISTLSSPFGRLLFVLSFVFAIFSSGTELDRLERTDVEGEAALAEVTGTIVTSSGTFDGALVLEKKPSINIQYLQCNFTVSCNVQYNVQGNISVQL